MSQGAKVSSFIPVSASQAFPTDSLYIVSNNLSCQISLYELVAWMRTNGLVGTLNGRGNQVTLTSSDVGLNNVTNVTPVTSITVSGVTVNNGIAFQTADGLTANTIISTTRTLTLGIGNIKIPWGSMNSIFEEQGDLSGKLASVGIQLPPRYLATTGVPVSATIPVTGGSVYFIKQDLTNMWVDVDCPAHVEMIIPYNLAPSDSYIGITLEVRQNNPLGSVSIFSDSVFVNINNPYGTIYNTTNGVGQRIKLICVSANVWEYR